MTLPKLPYCHTDEDPHGESKRVTDITVKYSIKWYWYSYTKSITAINHGNPLLCTNQ